MRTARLTVRVVNNGYEVLPGGSAEDFNRGRPAVFVGAWFAPARPRGLGTFEQTLKIEVPIPPGRSVDVTLEVKPSRPGKQYLGLGLFRSAVSGKDTGQVGDVTVLPVTVARGSWIDNHRPLFLRTLIGVHIVGFAVSLLLLYLWTHSQ